MIEVAVAQLGVDRTTNSPVVILRERDGTRVLPIWIGPAEATAIAMELQGVKFQRPLTHDLLKQIIVGLGGSLQHVYIRSVQENTYFAELLIRRGEDVFQVDARPSDSIALALRLHSPIFAADGLLGEGEDDGPGPGEPPPDDGAAEALKRYLEQLDPEDFGKFSP